MSNSNLTPTASLGKYIWCFQAGSTMRFEKYNIASMQYEYPFIMSFSHMTGKNLTTGTVNGTYNGATDKSAILVNTSQLKH